MNRSRPTGFARRTLLVAGTTLATALVALARTQAPATAPAPASHSVPPPAAAPATTPVGRYLGVAPGSRELLRRAEATALAVPTPDRARAWLRTLTEEPHVAGTPADKVTAEFVRDKLRAWGWQADLVEYEVLLNYPVLESIRLELIQPELQELPVVEAPLAADKDSASPDAWPAFHGYGVSGDVTGQVLYANYGRPEDFDTLDRLGISVKDRIVLVRYGAIFRGLKVLNAQKRGAAGVLIYSDPADDGYMLGDVYPNGPFRPASAIQRGSVQFLSLGPGDPSTPGVPSLKGARRLPIHPRDGFPKNSAADAMKAALDRADLKQGEAVPVIPATPEQDLAAWEKTTGLKRVDYFATIPSLPISYESARPILDALGGPSVPSGWQGGLPMAYHVGPGPAEVHFGVQMDYAIRPIWNVIATLKGAVEPERWVMVGNHRDAWTYGAVDPSSGTAATMEMCRALGEAVKAGWKPRRTVMYASWDGEEYGLVGSTEWAEQHAEAIGQKAVLMLNVDSAVAGSTLSLDGIPSLRDLVLSAAEAVNDPRTGKTLARQWLDARRATWASGPVDLDETPWTAPDPTAATASPASSRFSPQLGSLGSGSDFTAFVDHLGVPALDVDFGGGYGVYHSIYDNFFWMEKFGDPEFLTHATAARLYTAIAMRAAGAEIVPFTFTPYAEAIREQLDELRRMAARKERSLGKPFDFAGLPALIAAVRRFEAQAKALDRATAALADGPEVPAARLAQVNDALTAVERSFLLPKGLPGRTWFKHALYAPGLTTGYAAWPLPGVRQGLQEDKPELLAEQSKALIERLDAATEAMRRAAALATTP